ncbi:unnamed protein product [Paramecium sonneborni]|uniref:Uncharacterized protein n=1 Tax=Paramecium sonneborni TaxID=65129 RepID=A0A8S1QZX7_9CILI|nr:unnamed protein product [Paramecium sonneborni]
MLRIIYYFMNRWIMFFMYFTRIGTKFNQYEFQTIGGDQFILGKESFDDGNNKNDDGCMDCYLQCQDQCTLCLKEIVQKIVLKFGDQENKFITVRRDQLFLDIEECYDGNQRKSQCQKLMYDCQKGVFNPCKSGWILAQQKICTIFHGDGIVVDSQEQCAGVNNIPLLMIVINVISNVQKVALIVKRLMQIMQYQLISFAQQDLQILQRQQQ